VARCTGDRPCESGQSRCRGIGVSSRHASPQALANIFVASASTFPLDVSFPPVLLTHWRMDAYALVLERDADTGNPSLPW
jgi:hypothetical protein